MRILIAVEDIVTYRVASSVLSLGCVGRDWIKFGKELLGHDKDVEDLFTDSSGHDMKNSERLERLIHTWRQRDDREATIGVLQKAFCKIDKGGAFDILLDEIYQ